MSAKQDIFKHLYRVTAGAGLVNWNDYLIDVFEAALGLSRSEAERMATTRNVTMYWNWLLQCLDEDNKAGRTPLFSIQHRPTRNLAWFTDGITRNIVDPTQLQHLQRLSRRSQLLNAIDGVTPRQYEALGCLACSLVGAEQTHLTPPGRDKGIDFFAQLDLKHTSHVISGNGRRLRIIGQSKKNADPVEEKEITYFDKVIDRVRFRSYEVMGIVPSWFYTVPGPITGWFAAESGFQRGALDQARWAGILTTDSIDYGEILACFLPDGLYSPGQLSSRLDGILAVGHA